LPDAGRRVHARTPSFASTQGGPLHNLERSVSVGVVGLGYVGLPLAIAFAESGLRVVGVDTNAEKVRALEAGESYVEDVPSGRPRALIEAGRLDVSATYESVAEAEAVIICLPTPLDAYREPDLSVVEAGAERVSENLRPGSLVVLESTTYPGTTRELLQPIFERDGRLAGRDFFLAYSPERVDVGNKSYGIKNTPRVVGGVTPECTRRAGELYGRIADQIHEVSAPESAELSKLLENVFRGVNIALINELAVLCDRMGIDVWEVIRAASTKPFGFMPFYPGPGMGGHCIPIDPFYLSWRARAFDVNTEFIELAGRINVNMPHYAFGRISAALNAEKKPVNGSRVLVLGVAYKPNSSDLRESPSLKIMDLLDAAGSETSYHDPHVPTLPERGLRSVTPTEEELAGADCVVIATDHDAVDLRPIVARAGKVVDLRDAVRRKLGHLPPNVDVL
jgi:UDP-N-acetyl-D-glucosamine dehydrogenase